MAACGYCLAFTDECCDGRFAWCSHTARCAMQTMTFHSLGWCPHHGTEHFSNLGRCMKTKEMIPMSHILNLAWCQLDAQVDEIAALAKAHEQEGEPEASRALSVALQVAKARARGKAEILALLQPELVDADGVSAEAARRWQARQQPQPATSAAEGWYRAPDGGFTADPAQAVQSVVAS